MYFVTLWTTTSAPSASGRCSAGEANVLSTTTRAPAACATAATAWMSTIFSSGFDGRLDPHEPGRRGGSPPAQRVEVREVARRHREPPRPEAPAMSSRYVPP